MSKDLTGGYHSIYRMGSVKCNNDRIKERSLFPTIKRTVDVDY